MTYGQSLRQLLEGWLPDAPEVTVAGVTQDPDRVGEGDLYVALKGPHGHGIDRMQRALSRGCVAVLHDGLCEPDAAGVPVLALPRLASRLGELASRFWAAPSDLLTLAGVTGSHGKTSVSYFLAQVWQRSCGAGGIIGTLGYGPLETLRPADPSLPDVFRLNQALAHCVDSGVDHVAMEVPALALEQERCQTLQFDAAIFTNLSRDPRDRHGQMGFQAAAKRRLFSEFAPRFAVINHDDMIGRRWIGEFNGSMEVLAYGLAPGAELSAEVLAMDSDGTALRLDGPWGRATLRTQLMGVFNASHVLATAGTLSLLGMNWDQVVEGLELLEPVPGRMLRLGGEIGQPVIIVDRAATPDALAYTLQALRDHRGGRLICVFGCGGGHNRSRRAEMGRTAEILADGLVVTSDNPRYESPHSIINDVLGGLARPGAAIVQADRAAAILQAVAAARPGDVILIAGERPMGWQEIAGRRIAFSEAAVVRQALGVAA